jgi:hypothetical protein
MGDGKGEERRTHKRNDLIPLGTKGGNFCPSFRRRRSEGIFTIDAKILILEEEKNDENKKITLGRDRRFLSHYFVIGSCDGERSCSPQKDS